MRFPLISETCSGSLSELLEPWHEVAEGGMFVKAAVREGCAIEALCRRQPANLAVEPVVVVVAGETLERSPGIGERTEDLAVEDLVLERGPEGLNLPIGPGRIDLGADMPDLQLAQGLAEAREHAGHPGDEGRAVIAHEIQRQAAQLDAIAQPHEDRSALLVGGDAQADDEAGVVIDQADDPGLEEATARVELDEERPLDIDVPERVRAGALIARAALARTGWPMGAQVVQELADPAVANVGDLTAAQLGRDALGVPIRVQTHGDHDLLQPRGMRERGVARPSSLGHERGQTSALVRAQPSPERRAADGPGVQHHGEAVLPRDPHCASARTDCRDLSAPPLVLRWPAAARRQEAKPRSLLEGVSEPTPLRVTKLSLITRRNLIHGADPKRDVSETRGNLN